MHALTNRIVTILNILSATVMDKVYVILIFLYVQALDLVWMRKKYPYFYSLSGYVKKKMSILISSDESKQRDVLIKSDQRTNSKKDTLYLSIRLRWQGIKI